MNNINMETLIAIIVTIIGTSLLWLIYIQILKNRLDKEKNNNKNLSQNIDNEIIVRGHQNNSELNKELTKLKNELSDTKHASYMEGYDKAKNEFFLNVMPYYEEDTIGNNGFIVNDFQHTVKVGYKYQLYINNLPILEPTIKWEKIINEKKKEVDHAKIKSALEIIEKNLLPIVAQSNGILRFIPLS